MMPQNSLRFQRARISLLPVTGLSLIASIALAILYISYSSNSVHLAYDFSPSHIIWPFLMILSIGLIISYCLQSIPNGMFIFLCGFSLRVLLSFFLTYTYQGQDEQILHKISKNLSHDPGLYWIEVIIKGNIYPTIVASLYSVFGDDILIPKFLNSLIGSFLPLLVADITYGIFPNMIAYQHTLYYSMILPPLLFYSSMNLKEIPCTFLLVFSIWVLLIPRWSTQRKIMLSLFTAIITYFIRGAWALFPLLSVFLYLLFSLEKTSQKQIISMRKCLIIIFVAIIFMFPLRFVIDGVIEHSNNRLFIGTDASFGTFQNSQSSVTGSMLDMSNPWSYRNIVIQIVRSPFSPSPLVVLLDQEIPTIIEALNAITQYILMPFAFIGLLSVWSKREGLIIGIIGLSMLLTTAFSLMLGLTINAIVYQILQ